MKVGGVSERGKSIEGKIKAKRTGKGKPKGHRRRMPKKEGKGRRRLKKARKPKRNQTGGKRKTQATRGNQTCGAYSILTRLVVGALALGSEDVDNPSALDLDSHSALDFHTLE